MGQVTFGGPIFNVVSLKYIGKRQKKTFTKSFFWGGGSWPPCPLAAPLDISSRKSGSGMGRCPKFVWAGPGANVDWGGASCFPVSVTHMAEHLIEFITSSLDS